MGLLAKTAGHSTGASAGTGCRVPRRPHAGRDPHAAAAGEPLRHRAVSAARPPRRRPALPRARTIDGTYNDLERPDDGRDRRALRPQRAARPHVPAGRAAAILEPNPRIVSRELLTRERFIPATTLNLLAGAWLQFEVHDWFSHGKNETESPWELALADDDTWHERPMRIPRTRRDPTSDDDRRRRRRTSPPTATGGTARRSTAATRASRRRSAPARAASCASTRDGLLPPTSPSTSTSTGVAANFWVGLGAPAHALHARAQRDLRRARARSNPSWSDDELFDRARLVNAALIAKIHTVEWTPAIIAHPTTKLAMNANWWGLIGERFSKRFGRSGSEVLSGIPGSPTNHHGVAVLADRGVRRRLPHAPAPAGRLHVPLARRRPTCSQERTFPEIGALQTRDRLEEIGRRELALLLRRLASRRDHAAQLPALPPGR